MTDLPPPPIGVAPTPGLPTPPEFASNEPPAAVAKPPRKWLGRYGGWIVLAIFAALWVYLLFLQFLVWHWRPELPLIFGLGSFAIAALFLYQMSYRLTAADGIRARDLLLIFVFGGLASYTLSRMLEPLIAVAMGAKENHEPLGYTWLATTTEELCKIAVVIVIARWLLVRNARTGLFVGAAVGFGFAAYENVEKVFEAFLNAGGGYPVDVNSFLPLAPIFQRVVGSVSFDTGVRELLTPFAHPVWTALLAAAVFAAWRGVRPRVTRLVVITFVAVAVAHALWDFLPQVYNLALPRTLLAVILAYVTYAILGAAGAIAWNIVRRRINRSRSAGNPVVEAVPAA